MTTYDAEFFKTTVFLPKTEFPMRGNLPEAEPKWIKKWKDMDLYALQREQAKMRDTFTLHDGPPYANGHIHMGHALNKILKDVINRSMQMAGYDAPYVPGWDCHGLPIEWKIEEAYREKGMDKDDVDILQFRQECRDFAQKWIDIQSEEFQRLGVIGDWKNPYLTMRKRAEAIITSEIHKFAKNEGLYRGVRPVMWSVVEKTALAEAEVEYKEHKSVTIWVRFPVTHTSDPALEGADVVIWTTTPWTMPSNRAIAYGEDISYGLYEVKEVNEGATAIIGDKLLLADTLAEDVKTQSKIETLEKLSSFSGKDFEGLVCAHPLRGQGYDHDVRLLPADFVTDDAGTGFVHIAPGHGADDFYLGQKYGVEVTDNVSDDGKFRDHVPLFAGLEVYTQEGKLGDGNFAILREMAATGKLLAKGSLRHEYPHSWRSKAPLIFRTTPQWFISMETNDLRDKALEAIKLTNWVPAKGEARIRAMIEQRPDWCISRQRAWGVPIALFVNKKTNQVLNDDDVYKHIFDIFETEGSDAWWSRPAQDFLGKSYNADDYTQVFDIVDVWFESGSTHAFVVEDRDELTSPVDLYLEGSDQHRGWFHSSLLESCGTRGQAPYKTVLTHGFVLDEKGYKMSKSLGNIVAPQDLCDKYGADILRLWTVVSDYAEDIKVGDDIIKSVSDIYRRLRNTYRFLLGALDGFTLEEKLPESEYAQMPELERLMLHELFSMDAKIKKWREQYEFGRIAQALHNFCANELSAFYFDIRKDRLYCDTPDGFERRACRTVLAHIFDCLSTWLAPILCFTAEEAWTHRPAGVFEDTDSVHLRLFPEMSDTWEDKALAKKWDVIQDVRRVVMGAIEPYRKDKTIGSSLEAHPHIYVSEEIAQILEGRNVADICITSQASVLTETAPENAFALKDIEDVAVVFTKAEGQKCERCWKILPEVGSDPDFPTLSPRDAEAVRYFLKEQKAA